MRFNFNRRRANKSTINLTSGLRKIAVFMLFCLIVYAPIHHLGDDFMAHLVRSSVALSLPGTNIFGENLPDDFNYDDLISLGAEDDYDYYLHGAGGPPEYWSDDFEGEWRGITTRQFTGEGASNSWRNIHVSRRISLNFDIEQEFNTRPNIDVELNSTAPQVLILHTHTTESFAHGYNGKFPASYNFRSLDESRNIVAIGAVIANILNENGINTVHSRALHDYPVFSGAYARSEITAKYYLEKYPSIEIILDIHRDSIGRSDGTRVRPLANINGRNTAQIMLINGAQYGRTTTMPNYRENLRLGLRIQESMESNFPGLSRPLMFNDLRYNQHLVNGAILVEVGSEVNTFSEAVQAAEFFARSLVPVLESLAERPQ